MLSIRVVAPYENRLKRFRRNSGTMKAASSRTHAGTLRLVSKNAKISAIPESNRMRRSENMVNHDGSREAG